MRRLAGVSGHALLPRAATGATGISGTNKDQEGQLWHLSARHGLYFYAGRVVAEAH